VIPVVETPPDEMPHLEPCLICGVQAGYACAYCGRSLGCDEHRNQDPSDQDAEVKAHLSAGLCLATPAQRAELDAMLVNGNDLPRDWAPRIRLAYPLPWPMPVGAG
jgi:hypothetical protein